MIFTVSSRLSLILLTLFSFATLFGDNGPSSLDVARGRLKTAMRELKDPQLQKLAKETLKKVDAVRKDPKQAEKALHAVNKTLAVIKQKHTHSINTSSFRSSRSTSSSGTGCNGRDEISDLESEFKSCCTGIKRLLTELISQINKEFPCDMVMPIDEVPIVISQSGKYCVTTDLTYTGPGAAIQVSANDVTINFHEHDLILTDPNAIGILVENANEFVLENDAIYGTAIFKSSTSAAVALFGVNKATLRNIFTMNTTKGIYIQDSTDVRVEFCHLEAHEGSIAPMFPSPYTLAGTGNGAGMWVAASSGVYVDSCTFVGADLGYDPARTSFGLHVEETSKNVQLTNSTFNNLLGSIHATNVIGMLVDSCVATASTVSNFNIAQFGSCTSGEVASDLIIRNSTFTQSQSNQGFDGLLFLSGSNCLLENVIVDSSSKDLNNYLPSAIHIGNQNCSGYSNLVAHNCVVQGVNGRTLYLDNASKVVFEDSQISGANGFANVYLNAADSSSIRNCQIFNGSSGVIVSNPISSGVPGNSIENCLIYDNTNYGIQVLDQNMNYISGNHVWGNSTGIYLTFAGVTKAYYNTSCNNTVNSCHNVSPSQLPGASPIVAGSNVCCTP